MAGVQCFAVMPGDTHTAEPPSDRPRDDRVALFAGLAVGGAALFLLCGYELVRSVSASLYIEAYEAKRLPIVMALGPVGTLVLLYGYGWLLSLAGARRTMVISSLVAGLGLIACYLGLLGGSRLATAVLYVLREAYIVILIEQYWSFINSTLTKAQASRLNGPICGLGSVGAVSGSYLVGLTAQRIGSQGMVLLAAVFLIPAALMMLLAYRLGGEPAPSAAEPRATRGKLGLAMFRDYHILRYLAVLIVLTQVVATVLELRFNQIVEVARPLTDERSSYFGYFYGQLNFLAFILQFIGAPLVLRVLPVLAVHALIPAIHLLAGVLLLLRPSLTVAAVAYLLFKAFDYSLFRAAKELFYLPLPFDARYRAKEVIDAFGYRAAKGSAAGLLALAGKFVGTLPGVAYPAIALGAETLWLMTIGAIRANPPHPHHPRSIDQSSTG
ncbi:MAG: hypothetical protein HY706_02415 [Candidatus Hydrogenedentes bacterium]|nr:hypothetical protein [Candidatus Hydrogenedentota bacterium]